MEQKGERFKNEDKRNIRKWSENILKKEIVIKINN